ncbi:MAG TPA: SRPBCC family protein [Ktedonosporobacter sp.]|nr:SRPBCC family protein [Ktedonosporobacter sp.]
MKKIKMKATAVLNARPEDVYATIADYREGHPNILPKKHLYELQVEQGGYGAGTLIRFKSRFLGVEQSLYQRVSEPEPGRVLVEQDIDSTQQKRVTFTVIPVEQGQKSHVEIFAIMNPSPGLQGVIERMVISRLFPPVLRKELKLLEAVAQKSTHQRRKEE